MDRIKIEDALMEMGIPVGIKGFTYITDAVEIIDEKGTNISIMSGLYPAVAERNNTTSSRAERAIRHALGVARDVRANYETVNHYIGFANCENSSSLKRLHMMLKREESEG